ncbi:flavodoxin domain-containing protein [Longispora sp. NPDC051575]|uniref:flavodoxin domain-containing protein n=1 Tax=Longispora sp. NPDC051575 TaxID=3154943 RepID=UPI00342E5354
MTYALVAYGSSHGSTADIADWIGETLRERGIRVDVSDAATVEDVSHYDLVVLGGALYAHRWQRQARRFARRHRTALLARPVWLFSTGPLDRSAEGAVIAPVPQVARIAERISARGHSTFGGRLAPDTTGFLARRMARTMAGDFRNRAQVTAFAYGIAAEAARPDVDAVR